MVTLYVNTIEGFFSQLKRGIIGIYHHVSRKHIDRYCDEFAFRYNTRKIGETCRFDLALKSVNGKRIKYEELIQKEAKEEGQRDNSQD